MPFDHPFRIAEAGEIMIYSCSVIPAKERHPGLDPGPESSEALNTHLAGMTESELISGSLRASLQDLDIKHQFLTTCKSNYQYVKNDPTPSQFYTLGYHQRLSNPAMTAEMIIETDLLMKWTLA